MATASLCRLFLNIFPFLFLLLASLVCSLSFDLPSIGPGDANVRIKLEGNASITDQGIQLTPNEPELELMRNKASRATYVEPLHLWDRASGDLADFTTNFIFTISSDGSNNGYADGLAFFLANFSTPLNVTLTQGGGLGLMNETQSTPPDPFVAVVFDTFSHQTNQAQTNVRININSMLEPVTIKPWLNEIPLGMSNTASITYIASSKILQVNFTGSWKGNYQTDSLSYKVDLTKILPEFVSVGFSAATGWFFEKNTVSSWQFDSTPLWPNNVSASQAPKISPPQQQYTVPAPGPGTSMVSKGRKLKKGLVIAGSSIGVLVFIAVLSIAISAYFKKRGAKRNNHQIILGAAMEGEFEMAGYGPKNFSYSELASATDNFSEEHKLGEGGFGGVYSGFLRDLNLDVAVKRVSSQSKQGIEEYTSEVKIISQLRHRNLVPLHGWCHENGELLLVYEYMPGGSLDSHLFKRKSPLNWRLRYKIAQGLASALSYLHEDWEQCVLHRDIKSSNVLLDSSFNARLGDFGLAWLVDHEQTPEKTYLGGTPGYVAPECHITFKTSKESDVFSFGVVALEIACGRKAILANKREDRKSLVDWVWDLYGMGRLLEAADPKLCGNFEEQEMERLMIIGLWCAHPDSNSRPKISLALHCLKFQVQLPILPEKMPKPVYSSSLPNALSFPGSHFSGIKNVEIQEFEYPSSSSQNSRFTSSSASAGSSLPYTI
ncbi:L-type lectin-domain containing receptor kinase IX.1-like [Ipomoea triloba]|uniref:L-type lectin-domain containing receptor kinase IX.1-like n=1 Tax=Ipomoea triloba TaxID=35885 RepID=UPI00125CFCA0|nr:L-type lectin-domain containing receptor kinase IX.1-like [Ipomoea triloba]